MNNKEKYEQASQTLLALLKAKKEEQGLSEREISETTGFKQQSINDMLSGNFAVRLPNFLALLDALNGQLLLDFSAEKKAANPKTPAFILGNDALADLHGKNSGKRQFVCHLHVPQLVFEISHDSEVIGKPYSHFFEYKNEKIYVTEIFKIIPTDFKLVIKKFEKWYIDYLILEDNQ